MPDGLYFLFTSLFVVWVLAKMTVIGFWCGTRLYKLHRRQVTLLILTLLTGTYYGAVLQTHHFSETSNLGWALSAAHVWWSLALVSVFCVFLAVGRLSKKVTQFSLKKLKGI